MSPIKEPSYLADELRRHNFHPRFQTRFLEEHENVRRYFAGPMRQKRFGGPVVDWESYVRLFQNARKRHAIGEASASYPWSASAAQNIAARIPEAKIVMMLRNPAEKAYSQYLRVVSGGLVRHTFREQVRQILNGERSRFDVLNPLLEFSLYSEQLDRHLKAFRARKVKIYLYEDYRRNPGPNSC
jgi:hypothetical protein